MNNKLSLSDLADLLSRRTGCTKKMAEQFLKELFGAASSVISSGESLKISGFGTFKPVWVAPRNSVNVRTGEIFEIPGHYKLSFVPDKKMKDAVNAPFADFETVVLSDHVDLSAMSDNGNSDEKEFSGEKEETDSHTESDTDNQGPQKTEISPVADEPVIEENDSNIKDEIEPRPNVNRWANFAKALKDVMVIMLMLATVGGVGFVVYKIYQDRQIQKQRKVALAEKREKEKELVLEQDSVKALPADTVPKKIEPVITEEISDGITLTKLSLKHYGDKAFWVYIYLENKDKIANPNKIPVGVKVTIPPKENYNIDADNQQWIDDAKALADEILKKTEDV